MSNIARTDAVQSAPENALSVAAAPTATPRRGLAKRAAIGLALLAATAAAGDFGYRYLTVGQYQVSTDDAYVKADYTTVAPKVSGYIADVLVQDNQPVKAGQLLARIDDRDFRAAQAQAKADVDTTEAAIRNIDAQTELQQSLIVQAKAAIVASQASLKFAQADAQRYHDLALTGAGSVQRAQQTDALRSENAAELQRDQAGLAAAQEKIAVLASSKAQAEAQRDHALAVKQQADLNLSYTVISAPVDGTVGARSLRVGEYVTAGTQLMAVVPMQAVYVVANFKETQLTHMRDGQPVSIKIDGFPGVSIKGRVDSLSPASGLEFSLLPPDNATGNFTKIVQRVPVKITLDDGALSGLLRSGMSVEPTVDTKAQKVSFGQAISMVAGS